MKKSADDLLKIWYNKAQKMEELHRTASEHYLKLDTQFIIPTIVCVAVSGSLSYLSLGFNNDSKYFSITTGCLNLISSIMLVSKEYFRYTNKRFEHSSTSNSYLKIKNLIEIQLNLNKLGLNAPYEKMIPDIGTLFNKVDNEAPILPPHLISQIPQFDNIIVTNIPVQYMDSEEKECSTTENKLCDKTPIEEYNNNV
jgi:hypothetical protein